MTCLWTGVGSLIRPFGKAVFLVGLCWSAVLPQRGHSIKSSPLYLIVASFRPRSQDWRKNCSSTTVLGIVTRDSIAAAGLLIAAQQREEKGDTESAVADIAAPLSTLSHPPPSNLMSPLPAPPSQPLPPLPLLSVRLFC